MELDKLKPVSELVSFVSNDLEKTQKAAEETNMIPSFIQCRPISSYSDIRECLSRPPEWVNRVLPLKKRSGYVVKNEKSDCHTPQDLYGVRGRLDSMTVPKTLVCHDYNGGYHADSYVPFEGLEDKTLATDGYTFYNWAQIDYFVYFSHHFITIPPLAWVNAGHKHGVKILGTIITENDDGVKICNEEIFNTREKMREFVYHLVEIQKLYGFDGWLLNIENAVKNVELLRDFVEILTLQTHQQDSEGVIIWYDSVTMEGALKWQNQLNNLNRCFFDTCDGIFLNYSWDIEKLRDTASLAGARKFDVFVGIDVFGRNMYGGGKFNTYKAAKAVREHNLSMALFAPGWTHETMKKESDDSAVTQFLNRDDAFWGSLWPFLYTHPVNDYFETDFHIGLDINYYNLFIQQMQTSTVLSPQNITSLINFPTHSISPCSCLQREFFDGRNVCQISVDKLSEHTKTTFIHTLFCCNTRLNGRIGVYFLSKRCDTLSSVRLQIELQTCFQSGSTRKIRLLGRPKLLPVDNMTLMEVNELNYKAVVYDTKLNDIARKHMKLLSNPSNKGLVEMKMFEFTTTPCTLLEIGAIIQNGISIQLVEFGIIQLG